MDTINATRRCCQARLPIGKAPNQPSLMMPR
jgi:hypothetical protein